MKIHLPETTPESVLVNIAHFSPRLKDHFQISRHRYRGQDVFVLEDTIAEQTYQFPANIYRVVGLLNGKHSVEEILGQIEKERIETKDRKRDKNRDSEKQDNLLKILTQLISLDALAGDIPEELIKLSPASKVQEQSGLLGQLKRSVLFFRIPLLDPSGILGKITPFVTPIFSRPFFIMLVLIYLLALVQLATSWSQMTVNLLDNIFTQNNLFLLWCIYPVVKTVHEFAHALAVKKWGGEVYEMGVMFMLLMPVPYVNASSASSFTSKKHRIGVSSAGILAELFLTALALFVWAMVEPGLVRAIAFNVVLIGGFSTLLFNGNPLVRYDGYYVLTDILEIPNLATRSRLYLAYLVEKYLFGIQRDIPVVTASGEKKYYLLYGIASFLYRLTIYSSIFYIFASKFGAIGAVLGTLCLAQMLLVPGFRKLKLILISSAYKPYRKRITLTVFGFAVLFFLLIFIVPLPYYSTIEGVVWQPDNGIIRAKTAGTVEALATAPNSIVRHGDVLILCKDPELDQAIKMLESQIREYQLRKSVAFTTEPIEAEIISQRLKELSKQLSLKKEEKAELTIHAPANGKFILAQEKEFTGRFLKRGDAVGIVIAENTKDIVRILVSQEEIDLIAASSNKTDVLISSDPAHIHKGKVISDNPQATHYLPSKTLGTDGGGKILINPADQAGTQMLEEMYQLDIELDSSPDRYFGGSRAYVRFQLDNKPLFTRWTRKLRQLFLNQLGG